VSASAFLAFSKIGRKSDAEQFGMSGEDFVYLVSSLNLAEFFVLEYAWTCFGYDVFV